MRDFAQGLLRVRPESQQTADVFVLKGQRYLELFRKTPLSLMYFSILFSFSLLSFPSSFHLNYKERVLILTST